MFSTKLTQEQGSVISFAEDLVYQATRMLRSNVAVSHLANRLRTFESFS